MPIPTRNVVGLTLGTIMVGLGLFVLLRLLATGGEPLTARLWLDLAFALFFLVRGGLYLSNLRRTPRA
jgi:hypothetical protein